MVSPGPAMLRIDGARPLTPDVVAEVNAACDAAVQHGTLVVHVTGAPGDGWLSGVTVALVSKWERALRALERLPLPTLAIARGDCGGLALDAFLAADHRVAIGRPRLVLPVSAGATWPGMALYRLAQHGGGAAAVRRAALFGTPIGLEDALAAHLIDAVAADEEEAVAVAGRYGAGIAGPELAIRRQLLFEAPTVGFEEALGVHLSACERALRRTAAEGSTS
ncbi:enoyl-CoA-hydratase DpgB [Nonomuraea sp. NPDC049419]|uniref:enoyl-CoA-hydratase DpgB n=1 Tax=Nonomuraea sp. NPDC049419 TaxID=3155772 RepID=UPI0034430E2C